MLVFEPKDFPDDDAMARYAMIRADIQPVSIDGNAHIMEIYKLGHIHSRIMNLAQEITNHIHGIVLSTEAEFKAFVDRKMRTLHDDFKVIPAHYGCLEERIRTTGGMDHVADMLPRVSEHYGLSYTHHVHRSESAPSVSVVIDSFELFDADIGDTTKNLHYYTCAKLVSSDSADILLLTRAMEHLPTGGVAELMWLANNMLRKSLSS